ncbi:MAG TPA: IS21 family transposase [Blastocatellia bacterium]|nr:IS21 family transposase [Blastocatellia bacterium]
MIGLEQVANIRRLFHCEHWKIGTIAAELGLHPDAVRRALKTDRFKRGPAKRPTLVEPYLDFIKQTVEDHPRLRATRIYEMLRSRGYNGGVLQVRRAVATIRPAHKEAFLRLVTLPGEQAQADWAHFGEVTIGRARRRLYCFVITLSYSRALWLEFFFNQSLENVILAHVHAFEDWGGVARAVLYDNMKSVVLERRGDLIRFHPRLLELCGHYHFAARPCRPGRGNEKGRVERAIRYIRESFFAARSFTTIDDLNRQALAWRDEIAHRRPWPADASRTVAVALDEERPQLLSLPAHPFDADVLRTVRSHKTIYIRFDLNDYSIPPEAVDRTLTVAASPSIVRILDGTAEIARHRRCYDKLRQIEDPNHVEALLKRKRKATASAPTTRLEQAVPDSRQLLDAAFKSGEPIRRQIRILTGLLDDYGADELRLAIAEALGRQTPRASSVAFILSRRRRSSSSHPVQVDLSRRPELAGLSVPTHQLEIYDGLSDTDKND